MVEKYFEINLLQTIAVVEQTIILNPKGAYTVNIVSDENRVLCMHWYFKHFPFKINVPFQAMLLCTLLPASFFSLVKLEFWVWFWCFGWTLELRAAQQLRVSLCPSFTAEGRLLIWMGDREQGSSFDNMFVVKLRMVMQSPCLKERHWSSPKYFSSMPVPKINLFLCPTLQISIRVLQCRKWKWYTCSFLDLFQL